MHIVVLTPVYNDWESFENLLHGISRALAPQAVEATVVAVDDGSTEPASASLLQSAGLENIRDLQVVRLIRNLGHQKAIAVGLAHVARSVPCDGVVVMDADGEDRPEDIPLLLQGYREQRIPLVVAKRNRRHETFRFKALYSCFKVFFWLLTGAAINFGNFSFVSAAALSGIVNMHELWAQYPATLIRSRLPMYRISLDRGKRYAGESKMNLVSLVIHGMQGMAVFVERVFVRIAITLAVLFFVSGTVILTALFLKTVGMATPGWASNLIATFLVILVQALLLSLSGLLIVLRSNQELILRPANVYEQFIQEVKRFPEAGDAYPRRRRIGSGGS